MLWLALMGCPPETSVNKLYPDASVVPEVLDFGEVVKDYPTILPVQISNTGQAVLTIADITINADQNGIFELGELPTTLGIDETAEVNVTFTPANYLTYTGTLTVESDADDHPVEVVTLTGTGIEAPTPDIELSPQVLDFGTIGVSSATNFFTISNVGDGTLHISGMTQAGSGTFTVLGDSSFTLEPGDSNNIVVQYSPTTDTGDNGKLVIASDDPDESSIEMLFLGNGGGDFEYPVAIIDGPTTTEPRDTVEYSGIRSTAPAGHNIVEYRWTVTPPAGSAATMNDVFETMYVNTDIAGSYTISLTVVDDYGVESAPATLVTEAIPQELLHVELFWDTGSADLDLHLLNEEVDLFTLPNDCNYCNQVPEWGSSGTDDNPTLDLDDRFGYGPENINIDDPAVDNYYVRVHYFVDNGDEAVVATVKIYLYGVEEASFTKVITSDNYAWDVAQIHWGGDSGSTYIVEENSALYEPEHRGCFTP